MKEFLRGRSRKVGVLTLVMALAFMAGWIRSNSIKDVIWIYPNDQTLHWLVSKHGSLRWIEIHDPDKPLDGDIQNRWRSFPLPESELTDRLGIVSTSWSWDWHGFHFKEYHLDESPREQCTSGFIPYWSITFLLTVLSAYLLLSKPRQSTTKKMSEPITVEGGATA